MDAATSNAAEMIDKLTLFLNRVRQASITRKSSRWSVAPRQQVKGSYGKRRNHHRKSSASGRPAWTASFPRGRSPYLHRHSRHQRGIRRPQPIDIICEVEQHIGEGRVRTVALQPPKAWCAACKPSAWATGTSAGGSETLGRILNVSASR